jgi:hypothetical protein
MPAIAADESLYAGTGSNALPMKNSGAVRVRFYMDAVPDKTASATEGRPIFKDVEFVEKHVVGDKTSIIQRPATDGDRRQHAQEYALFKAGDEEQLVGTPLKVWPGVTKSQIEELAYFKVRTVEQLSEVSDGNLSQIGPIRALRDRARDWLAAAKGQAPATALRAELAEKDKRLAGLEAELAELKALVTKQPKK